jgi:hypothetical protein
MAPSAVYTAREHLAGFVEGIRLTLLLRLSPRFQIVKFFFVARRGGFREWDT